jgi:hypothetical protein
MFDRLLLIEMLLLKEKEGMSWARGGPLTNGGR